MTRKLSDDLRPEVGVYCEIDTLLDTRLATLYEVHPDLVPKVLSEKYIERHRDEFLPITDEQFSFLYENRNAETLAHALPTMAVRMAKEMCLKLMRDAASSPHLSGTALTINIYPYKLTEDEITYLIATFAKSMSGYIDVRVIDKSPEELTPAYCNQNFGGMFMYDCSKWLDAHAKNDSFRTNPMTGVTLFIPMIRFGPKATQEQLNLLKQSPYNEFRLFEIQASPIITINCLNTAMFCIDLEEFNKRNNKTTEEKTPETPTQ